MIVRELAIPTAGWPPAMAAAIGGRGVHRPDRLDRRPAGAERPVVRNTNVAYSNS